MSAIEYRGGITRDFLLLGGFDLLGSSFIIAYGFYIEHTWKYRGIPFIVFGGILLLSLLVVLFTNLSSRLIITSTQLSYWKGEQCYILHWNAVSSVCLPPPKKRYFRYVLVGDERNTLCIDSFTFPQFEKIVKDITSLGKIRKEAQKKGRFLKA